MARKTYLVLVNDVLRKLRHNTVTSVGSSDYSQLIGLMVNQAKREVEDAWTWLELRRYINVTTVSGTQRYALTGFGERYRLDCIRNDAYSGAIIKSVESAWFENQYPTDQAGRPQYWRATTTDGNGDPQIDLYPVPNAAETLRVHGWINQDDLSLDADILKVPSWPVVLGAYVHAIEERGEDAGTSLSKAQAEYQGALDDAIARDNLNSAKGTASDWRIA